MHKLQLPIDAHRREIIEAVRSHQVVVVAGETGSGKTTQVPRFLLEAGYTKIGVTQPRRVAAMGVADFVAKLEGCKLGTKVGYQIRHDKVVDEDTGIKFMTEGILLREMLKDPHLKRYDALVLDEVHERGVNQDFILALVKKALAKRPDLKVIVMSATIDEQKFADYFRAPVYRIKGRTYPVDIVYADRDSWDAEDAAEACARKAISIAPDLKGDILIFMPDFASIKRTVNLLERHRVRAEVLPLYGSQSSDEQRKVFRRTRHQRIIVSTNIAETSVTLDGVVAVIDSGFVKQMSYLHGASMSSLRVIEHSRAGCEQRAGRAGRTRPGTCYRMYTERSFEERPAFTTPEIKRTSLESVLLQMKVMGMSDAQIDSFDFMDPPSQEALADARQLLRFLGATDEQGNLLKDGRFMAQTPLHPMLTRMLLTAAKYGCVKPVVSIVASFSTRSIFVRPKDKANQADRAHMAFRNESDESSDFLSILKAYEAWRDAKDRKAFAKRNFLHGRALEEIHAVSRQLLDDLKERRIKLSDGRSHDAIGKSITSGLLMNLLRAQGLHDYANARRKGVYIHPSSNAFGVGPQLMVALDIVATSKVYARTIQSVKPAWVDELIPAGEREEKVRDVSVFDYGTLTEVSACVSYEWRGVTVMEAQMTLEPGLTLAKALIKSLVETHLGQLSRAYYVPQPWHPHVKENVRIADALSEYLPGFARSFGDVEGLTTWYAKLVIASRALSFEAVKNLDLRLRPEDFLNGEELKAFQVKEAERTEQERIRAEHEVERLRQLREQQLARMSDRERQIHASIGARQNAQRRRDDDARKMCAKAKAFLQENLSSCPICGTPFRAGPTERFTYCTRDHEWNRVQRGEEFVYAKVTTNGGDEVAEIIIEPGSKVTRRVDTKLFGWSDNWTGRHFGKLMIKIEEGSVIPAEIEDLEGYLDELAFYEEARAEWQTYEAWQQRIKKGEVAELTFSIIGGQPGARVNGMTYRVEYEADTWPEDGETWYCELPGGGKNSLGRVKPLSEVKPLTTEEDLKELENDIRERYGFFPKQAA